MTDFIYYHDVSKRLGVTEKQIEMAVYSGLLPPPSDLKCWGSHHVEPFINNWAAKLARANPKADNKNIVTGNCTFPRHQR